MTTDKTAIARRHLEAVTHMLLGNDILQASAAIIAGEQIDAEGRMHLAQLASTGNLDLVHLEFGDTDSGYGLVGISLVVPREGSCYMYTGCRLYMGESDACAIILPRSEVPGHFKLLPDELVHVACKPIDIDAGVARAAAQVRLHVTNGVEVGESAEVNVFNPIVDAA